VRCSASDQLRQSPSYNLFKTTCGSTKSSPSATANSKMRGGKCLKSVTSPPNEQCLSSVLPQVARIHFVKQVPVEPLLIFWTVATRASVRVVAKGVCAECRVQVLDSGSQQVCFIHTFISSGTGCSRRLRTGNEFQILALIKRVSWDKSAPRNQWVEN
jgi:hypothetical protein